MSDFHVVTSTHRWLHTARQSLDREGKGLRIALGADIGSFEHVALFG